GRNLRRCLKLVVFIGVIGQLVAPAYAFDLGLQIEGRKFLDNEMLQGTGNLEPGYGLSLGFAIGNSQNFQWVFGVQHGMSALKHSIAGTDFSHRATGTMRDSDLTLGVRWQISSWLVSPEFETGYTFGK